MRIWIEIEINDFDDYKRIGTLASMRVREAYRLMQGGKCLYCEEYIHYDESIHVAETSMDHNHKTGKINGVMHTACNTRKAMRGEG